MEPTEGSETSAELKRTPGIYLKERIQYLKPDESLKSSFIFFNCYTRKMDVPGTSETSVAIYQSTRRCTLQDFNMFQ